MRRLFGLWKARFLWEMQQVRLACPRGLLVDINGRVGCGCIALRQEAVAERCDGLPSMFQKAVQGAGDWLKGRSWKARLP